MKIVDQVLAHRRVQKLKHARTLPPADLATVKNEIVAAGSAALSGLFECLPHAEARPHAIEVLGRLLTDETVSHYLDALALPDQAVVSGVADVLARGMGYDVSRLLDLLEQGRVPKSVIESLLTRQAARIPIDRALFVLPALPRESQVLLFRFFEKRLENLSVREFLPLLSHTDPWIRVRAARLAVGSGDEGAVPALIEMLGDAHAPARQEAIAALHGLRAKEAVPALIEMLRDADYQVQSSVIDALVGLADASAVPQLIELLADDFDLARRAAVEVLNAVATPEAIQDLVRALGDEDWWVRARAADALGSLGGDKVVQAAACLLETGGEPLRRHAIEILATAPGPAAVPVLLKALDDPDWWVRERAIDALGKAGDARAVMPLLLRVPLEGNEAGLCVRALGAIGDPRALGPLVAQLDGERADVRDHALAALLVFPREKLSRDERLLLEDALRRNPAAGSAGASLTGVAAPPVVAGPPTPAAPPQGLRSSFTPVPGATPTPVSPIPGVSGDAVRRMRYGDLPEGTLLLGRYRVVRTVGKGGFASVYLVEDATIGEEIIVKILNPQLSIDETVFQRFVQELKLTRRITHRNVIRIHDFLDLDGAYAVSMEYFPGRDLRTILAEEGPLPVGRMLHIAAQVLEGLAAAHAVGVVHRDIKPANILVDANDTAKVVDFGLASARQTPGSRLTASGLLIGSPEYMAPEQISDEAIDQRADLYSLGVVLYEALSGVRPFSAETPVKVLFQHLEGSSVPLAERMPSLPAGVCAFVHRAMARNPEDRPADAVAMRAALENERGGLAAAA
ncbi:MAG: protein kinase domain-containing protein [Candidatus Eiseniibacteriota bacterium]